jgi:sulfur carrier protein ThiS
MVKINGKYIPKEKYKDTLITDNDDVQVIHSIAGG